MLREDQPQLSNQGTRRLMPSPRFFQLLAPPKSSFDCGNTMLICACILCNPFYNDISLFPLRTPAVRSRIHFNPGSLVTATRISLPNRIWCSKWTQIWWEHCSFTAKIEVYYQIIWAGTCLEPVSRAFWSMVRLWNTFKWNWSLGMFHT